MRVLFMTVGFILTLILPLSISQAEGLQFFRIGTGGIAGTYFPIGGMLAHAISNPPGSRPCDQGGSCGVPGVIVIAQSANGSVANVKAIQRGSLESGFAQSDVAFWAYTGTGTFKGEDPIRELRTIANLYAESITIVGRKNSGIRIVITLVGQLFSVH